MKVFSFVYMKKKHLQIRMIFPSAAAESSNMESPPPAPGVGVGQRASLPPPSWGQVSLAISKLSVL